MATTEQIVHTLERMALRREHSGCVTDKGRRWAAAELEALRAAIALMRGQSEAEYVITLLVEAGHVDQERVDQARRIVESIKPKDTADEQ